MDNKGTVNSNKVLNTEHTTYEIKEIIKKALVKNSILGYLHNNILYMQSFGKSNSLDKIFAGIGIFIILGGSRAKELEFGVGVTILVLGIGCFILSAIFKKLLKYYLVYDIDREVFYTITNIHNKTVKKTQEISRRDIIELGVNVTDKDVNNDKVIDYNVINFKGDIMDNPGLRTSFVALKNNGKIVNISDPVALRQPHEVSIERCKLFSECFGLDYVICEKNECLKTIKEGNKNKFVKYQMNKEWEKVKKNNNLVLWLVCTFALVMIFIICISIYFAGKN